MGVLDRVGRRQRRRRQRIGSHVGQPDLYRRRHVQGRPAVGATYRLPALLRSHWSHALALGQLLPTLPLWLSAERVVPLNLEASYEQACTDIWLA